VTRLAQNWPKNLDKKEGKWSFFQAKAEVENKRKSLKSLFKLF